MGGEGHGGKVPEGGEYLIVRPERMTVIDILSLLVLGRWRRLSSYGFVEASGSTALKMLEDAPKHWIILLTWIAQKVLLLVRIPLSISGRVVEYVLNFISLNGGDFLGRQARRSSGVSWWIPVIPDSSSAEYRSLIGFMDGRRYLSSSSSNEIYHSERVHEDEEWLYAFEYSGLCMMASKVAYENQEYIKNVVNNFWKMNFVEFFDGWNEYLKARTTQAFVFTDKAADATIIVVAFRGTQPFEAKDWITDVDLSWLSLPGKRGSAHLGFLRALGLDSKNEFPDEYEGEQAANRMPAYYAIREALEKLTREHSNARILVTGHSLGGALAALFPLVLDIHGRKDIIAAMHGVMTFGQPRVGDGVLAEYMVSQVLPESSIHRMVYRFDLVPRVPPAALPAFPFRHFGTCIYYTRWTKGEVITEGGEVPNPNYVNIGYILTMHFNALLDLWRGLWAGWSHGADYKEGIVSLAIRAFGLAIPGLASHSPRDYVNAGRLAHVSS